MRERMEAMLRSGRASSVIEAANLHFGASPPPNAETVWMAVAAMRASASLMAWGQVVEWAERAQALKAHDKEAEGWIHLFLGVAHMYLGNIQRSEKALAAFRRTARKTPALERLLPYGLYNWAKLMRFQGRPDQEVKHLQQAARAFGQQNRQKEQLQSELAIVWSYLLRGLPTEADAQWRMLEDRLSECDDVEVHHNAELARALHASLLGNTTESDAICRTLLSCDGLLTGQRIDALWVLGCNARARGDMALTEEFAQQARQLVIQDYWPPQAERVEALLLRVPVN